jgi:Putative addiction module component
MFIDANELLSLPNAEKLRLVEMLWDELGKSTSPIPLPSRVDAEGARRRAEMRNSELGIARRDLATHKTPEWL